MKQASTLTTILCSLVLSSLAAKWKKGSDATSKFSKQLAEANSHRNGGQSKILLIGDSCAAFAGPGTKYGQAVPNTLQTACCGSTVVNKGDSGTSASEWIANSGQWIKDAIQSGSGWTHVWISIGANDMPGLSCAGAATIKTNLSQAIDYVKAEAPNVHIVFTGYPISAKPLDCSISQTYANVNVPMQELANDDPKVTFVDIGSATSGVGSPTARTNANCGGSTDADGVPPCRGNWTYFFESEGDGIHMNAQGYAKAWAIPQIQSAFGCFTDDDDGIIAKANILNQTITGCSAVENLCEDNVNSATVMEFCKKTCTTGCTTSSSASAS